jgi:hypothetical protein
MMVYCRVDENSALAQRLSFFFGGGMSQVSDLSVSLLQKFHFHIHIF